MSDMARLGTHAVKVKGPDDKVWYFLTPGGGENRLRVHAATMDQAKAERIARQVAEQNEGYQAKAVELCPYRTPGWLRERNNDPCGTPATHPFWQGVSWRSEGAWRLFARDGWWFGYKTTQNAWAHFSTEAEALAMARGPQTDVWA